MVSLTFNFNKDILAKEGLTEDELLKDMRKHAKEFNIQESPVGTFWKTGDSLTAILGYAVRYGIEHPEYYHYLDSWIADIDGRKEDCKTEYYRCVKKYGKLNSELIWDER